MWQHEMAKSIGVGKNEKIWKGKVITGKFLTTAKDYFLFIVIIMSYFLFLAADLKICTGRNACCTKSIEDDIVQNSEKIFKAQLEDKIIILRHMLNSNLNSFRSKCLQHLSELSIAIDCYWLLLSAYFYNSLNACHEHLDALFGHTYGPFYQSNSQVLSSQTSILRGHIFPHGVPALSIDSSSWSLQIFETFFNRLRAFSSPFSDAKVSQITGKLFEDMFVIMFQLMNPMVNWFFSLFFWKHYSKWKCFPFSGFLINSYFQHSVTPVQRRCMLDGMAEIAPFGDVPDKVLSGFSTIFWWI